VPRCPRVTGDGEAELPNGGEARGDAGLEGTETNLGLDTMRWSERPAETRR
jgi:hypothetical protein